MPFAYYAQIPLIPILFLVILVGNLYHAVKNAVRNSYIQTRADWQSHKRLYMKKGL